MIIKITWDYSKRENKSYQEVLELICNDYKGVIYTTCLEFFNFKYLDNYVVVDKRNGEYIVLEELLDNDGSYSNKEIRKTHNAGKLLLSGSLKFKSGGNREWQE